MKQRFLGAVASLLIFAGLSSPVLAAPADPTGYWTTGKNQAVTQIYSCGEGLLCGELVGFPMDHATDPMPKTSTGQPQCHFVFIRYLQGDGDDWKGKIINPKTGNSYGAKVSLTSPDQLQLRGYLFFQALGATRFWSRYKGPPPPADCRMAADALE